MASQIDLGAVVPIGKGDWNPSTTYERANIVRHNSTAWVCKVATSTGVEPTESSSDWYLLVKDTSSVTSVNGMSGDVVVDIVTTPDANDNSNKIANTEWVRRHVNNIKPSVATNTTVGVVKAGTGVTIGSDGAVNVSIFNGSEEGLVPSATSANSNSVLLGNGTWKELPVFSSSVDGLVPASGATAGKVLQGNGTWDNTSLVSISEKSQALNNVSGSRAIDLSFGLFISATITGATTFSFTNTPTDAVVVVLQLTNGGSQTITWPTSIKWAGGKAPNLTASGVDIIVLTTSNSGSKWYGIANLKYA